VQTMSELRCPNGVIIEQEIIDSILEQFVSEFVSLRFITVPYLHKNHLNDDAMTELVLRDAITSLLEENGDLKEVNQFLSKLQTPEEEENRKFIAQVVDNIKKSGRKINLGANNE